MAENSILEDMGCDAVSTSCKGSELDEMGTQKISVSDQTANSLQTTNFKSDSFIVDMERLSHLTDKDITPNSRFTLQRNLSRKVSQQRANENRKINPSTGNEQVNSTVVSVVSTSSPRAAVAGASMPEKPMVVTMGTTDHPKSQGIHHQITIMTGNIGAGTGESKWNGKRFNFRRSPPSWTMDPRRILLFFATLSSMGTMLLIYFTLSVGKINGDDSALN